ncbi:MAG: histidinol-phosphate transaminase [Thermoplasmatota archaeon]
MNRREKVLGWTRPSVRGLKPYYKAPVDGQPLRLDQNTNLYGRNPALDTAVPNVDQYPSRDADDLLQALADFHGLTPDHFVVGNGSDEILDLLTKAFTAPGQTLACPTPSYSLYPFYAQLQDLKVQQVRLHHQYGLDVDGLLAAQADLTLIATPNNPTGNLAAADDLERLLQESTGVVVLDEAYIEFAGLQHSFLPRIDEYDNLCVMRTLSKAYGLAGLRIGYLAGNTDLVERLRLVKPPFNLNTYSEAVAVAALEGQEWVDEVVAQTRLERERLAEALAKRGFRVHPSDANFILSEHAMDPAIIASGLRARGVLIRTFPGKEGLERKVRFGIGTAAHTDRLLAALDEVLA